MTPSSSGSTAVTPEPDLIERVYVTVRGIDEDRTKRHAALVSEAKRKLAEPVDDPIAIRVALEFARELGRPARQVLDHSFHHRSQRLDVSLFDHGQDLVLKAR
jgi:hypothetical protein